MAGVSWVAGWVVENFIVVLLLNKSDKYERDNVMPLFCKFSGFPFSRLIKMNIIAFVLSNPLESGIMR